MIAAKSCIRCTRPLPANVDSTLCNACTADGRASDTPENLPALQFRRVDSSKSRSQFDDTTSHVVEDALLTDVAAANRFKTGHASQDNQYSRTDSGQIQITGYSIVRELGQGGCGVVYEAVQLKTKRTVAVKILLGQTLTDRIRFDREAKALGKIKDPRVIAVYEAGVCEAGPYYCMERMTGGSLAQQLKTDGPMPPRKVAELMESISRGIETVHGAGLFHRDLKPGNILLDDDGNPKIADFGLAKTYEANSDDTTLAKISMTGGLLGTPAFMAPEQAARRNDEVDARTDVYGLGTIMYQCLTGKSLFTDKSASHVLDRVMHERPSDPSSHRRGLPRELEAICLKCLEKDSKDRYQSAQSLADDLAAWLRGDETIAKPATRLQRTARWAKRHSRKASIAALVLAAAATINLAGMWIKGKPEQPPIVKPDESLQQLVKEIDTGKEVVLIGKTGMPRYYPQENNPVVFEPSNYSDDTCTINSTTSTLFELLREEDLPDEFCLRADVRHQYAAHPSSRCGLFVGKFEHTDNTNQRFVYYNRFAFSDDLRRHFHNEENFVQLNPSSTRFSPGNSADTGYPSSCNIPIGNPQILAPRTWRHLEMTVTNKALIISVTEEKLKPQTRQLDCDEILTELQKSNRLNAPDPQLLSRGLAAILRGSIGLHVTLGVANFKNVTVQKITSKKN